MAKKRSEVRKEKKLQKRNKVTVKVKRFGTIFSILFFLGLGFGFYFFYSQIIVPNKESARPLSILLVGSDVSSFRDEYFMDTKPEKTDSLIVLTFNPNTYQIDMTSIPRDTSVDYVCDTIQYLDGTPYEGDPYQDQINELYQVSGKNMTCLTDSVENFLNIPIDYYAKVNMDQLAEIIDEVGGIEIEVYAPDYYLSQINQSLDETYYWTDGEVVEMNGDEAMTYARARHDSEQDYGRGIRQQQVIQAILEAIMSNGVSTSLIDNLFSLVDTNMPIKLVYDYMQYMLAIQEVKGLINGTTSMEVGDLPDSVWLNLYELTGFDGNLIGTEETRQKEIDEFSEYLKSDSVSSEELSNQVMTNHQLYNEAYTSHFNVVYDQLYEVSNELRKNLELEEEDVTVPQNEYGDNYAYGLMPTETTLADIS